MYLFRRKGGGALMHVYVWEHIVSFYYSTVVLLYFYIEVNQIIHLHLIYKHWTF